MAVRSIATFSDVCRALARAIFRRQPAADLTNEEQQAFAGEPIALPAPRVTYREFALDDPSAPGPITERNVVGGGERFSVSTARAGDRPALIINWSTMEWLLDEEDRLGGGGGIMQVFASTDEREAHLEELWREGRA